MLFSQKVLEPCSFFFLYKKTSLNMVTKELIFFSFIHMSIGLQHEMIHVKVIKMCGDETCENRPAI